MKVTIIAILLLSKNCRISLVNFNRACSVLAPDLKPNCDDERILLLEKYSYSQPSVENSFTDFADDR